MKKINLEEIILSETDFVSKNNKYSYNIEDLKRCMKEVCRQTLELAAENALLNINGILEKSNGQQYLVDEGDHYCETLIWIDKQSILNIINQVE